MLKVAFYYKKWQKSCYDLYVKQPSFARRKLSTVVRKGITSYYTQQEQEEVANAARKQKISMSSFVANAALTEARRISKNK